MNIYPTTTAASKWEKAVDQHLPGSAHSRRVSLATKGLAGSHVGQLSALRLHAENFDHCLLAGQRLLGIKLLVREVMMRCAADLASS